MIGGPIAAQRRVDVRAQELAPARRRDQLGERPVAGHPRKDLPYRARPDLIAQRAVGEPLLALLRMMGAFFDAPRDLGVKADLVPESAAT